MRSIESCTEPAPAAHAQQGVRGCGATDLGPLKISFDFGNSPKSKACLRGQDGDLHGLKVFFVPSNYMVSRNCLGTCELNVVLKVGQCRGERVGDKFLVERDQTKPPYRGLSISAG